MDKIMFFRLKVFLSIFIELQSQVHGDTIAEIKLVQYSIPGGTDIYGHLCDQGNPFGGVCDPWFQMCFDQPDSDPDMLNCKYKTITTGFYQDQNSIRFGSMINGGVSNPIVVSVPMWKGGITLKIAVTDKDYQLDDSIDSLYYTHNAVPAKNVDQSSWQSVQVTGTRTIAKTILRVDIRVYCGQNWFGSDCLVYCDTARNDGFICDRNTGRPICNPGTECRPSTLSTTTSDNTKSPDTKNSSPIGGISTGSAVAITIVVILVLIGITLVFLFIRNRNKNQNSRQILEDTSESQEILPRSRWFFIRIYHFFFSPTPKTTQRTITNEGGLPALPPNDEILALPAPDCMQSQVTAVKSQIDKY